MLNKADIIQILSAYQFPIHQYWIMAGSALVIHGVRELTGDIDIGCDATLFEMLVAKGHDVVIRDDGSRSLILDDNMEVFENWMADKIVHIKGLPVASLETVLAFKRAKRREKDIKDIALIEAFLNSMDENRREQT